MLRTLTQIWLFSLTLTGVCLYGTRAAADDFSDFSDAKNAYDAGEYETARKRFEALLAKLPESEAIVIETHKFLGVTYLFLNDEPNAEIQFIRLLNLAPDFSLDPLVFPIDAVDFFSRVKREQSTKLAEIEAARAEAEKARQAAEKERLEAEIERLTRTVYVQKTEKRGSLIVALMPFGAGQFQNEQKTKGIVFLSVELALLTSTVVTFVMHEGLNDDAATPFESESARADYEDREEALRIANSVSLIGLGLVAIIGITDSMIHYQPFVASWKKADEKTVPPDFRTRPAAPSTRSLKFTPTIGTGGSLGLHLSGKF